MARLKIDLDERRLTAWRRYAHRQRIPISQLTEDYVDYLLAGGTPVTPSAYDKVTIEHLTAVAMHGGAFNWLAHEPDLYSASDGKAVVAEDEREG